jgi:excisionase family DNA binding protein
LSDEKVVFTVEQVAEQLQVHTKTVYRLLDSGELKGIRVGRVWRITPEALNAFLQLPYDQVKELNA